MDNWRYSTIHKSACKVVDEQTLWGQTVCRVWLPNQDAVVRVPQYDLQPLSSDIHPKIESHRVAYISAAAKVAEVLEGSSGASDGQVLLAPMESSVIPLPHQIHTLSRAISGDRVRYLLADEVGLGKTVEAGLVMRELKLRGLVRRTLVVTPKSLAMQWVAEMDTHFNESFSLVNPGDLDALERLERPGQYVSGETDHTSDYNPWMRFPQAIVTMDAVKPLTRRRGSMKDSSESAVAGEKMLSAAEQPGQELFDTMQDAHFAAVAREEERGMIAFASRRKAIDRLGLPEVRQFRLARLDEDETQWRSELKSAQQIIPEMRTLLMMEVQRCKSAEVQS